LKKSVDDLLQGPIRGHRQWITEDVGESKLGLSLKGILE